MSEVITRREAFMLGRNVFYTGRLCRNGHLSERYVINGSCKDCVNWKRDRIPKGNNVLVVPVIFDIAPAPEEMLAVKALLIAWAPAALDHVRKEAAAQSARVRLTERTLIEHKLAQPEGDEDYVPEPARRTLMDRLRELTDDPRG